MIEMFPGLQAWIVWLIIAGIFILIEAISFNLVTIWFSIGAIASLIASFLGASIAVQWIIFGVASLVILVLVFTLKPFKRFRHGRGISTNADRYIGQQGIVMHTIDPVEGHGLVKVMGQVWSAVSKDSSPIEEGASVTVHAITGVRLIVSRVEKQPEVFP